MASGPSLKYTRKIGKPSADTSVPSAAPMCPAPHQCAQRRTSVPSAAPLAQRRTGVPSAAPGCPAPHQCAQRRTMDSLIGRGKAGMAAFTATPNHHHYQTMLRQGTAHPFLTAVFSFQGLLSRQGRCNRHLHRRQGFAARRGTSAHLHRQYDNKEVSRQGR